MADTRRGVDVNIYEQWACSVKARCIAAALDALGVSADPVGTHVCVSVLRSSSKSRKAAPFAPC
jgi:hypothetical protein